MKRSIALFLFVLFCASACSQYTCPTYAKKDVQNNDTKQVVEDKQTI